MSNYLTLLAEKRDFRRLWLGASVSLIGDGMTFVALSWLVLARPGGTVQLGLLAACFTAPVLIGGLAVGPLLDRFDKRAVLAADSVLRGVTVGSIPLVMLVGDPPEWLPFVVAVVYGLLKMVPLAGVPAAIPDLVEPRRLDAANALESVSYSLSGIIGYLLAGPLIATMGPANVLALDAASYLCFAVLVRGIRHPLRPHGGTPQAGEAPRGVVSRAPRVSALLRDRVLLGTTLAFMAFNIAEGAMVLVVGPWLAKDQLPGGVTTLSLLLVALSAGELLGGALAGIWQPRFDRVTAIALMELAAAIGFLAVLAVPHGLLVAAGFLVIGLFSAPMTIWAQSLRMERIPAPLRGRAFGTLRTLMQATPPVGAAVITPLLAAGNLSAAVLLMAAFAGLPALALLSLRST
ncbi:MFS transporter [Streptosporangium sp. KLBMP 9127]|nr:MFS transporter [Streptosporangium sp. KLBMP 9127]